jgi:hypothetical protein
VLLSGIALVAFAAAPSLARAASSPPAGVTGMALDGTVELAWQPAVGASAYSVYRGTTPTSITTQLTPVGGVVAPGFNDTTAVDGTTYYYVVRAIVAGAESGNSLVVKATPRARSCSSGNATVLENCYPGDTGWMPTNVASVANGGVEGFTTANSIPKSGSLDLKVSTPAGATFHIDIYRSGYYGGAGARLYSEIQAVPGGTQPGCTSDAATGLYDCANWATSATITTTSDWPSGVYLVKIVRDGSTATDNQFPFVVRDDSRSSDLLYGVGFSTYEAYNNYGGKSLYDFNSSGSNTVAGTPRAVKVSFDRPYEQPFGFLRDWYPIDEYATVNWLEHMGYDVSYVANTDLETQPGLVLGHKAYLSPAHDEYVSAAMRQALTAARDNSTPVNLFFTGANEVYWKIRYENGPYGGVNRVEVCYKTVQSGPVDPSGISTSTWRDPAGANQPENALTGEMYIGDNDNVFFPMTVSAGEGFDRLWRYTGLDAQAFGTSTSFGSNLVGWEWDARVANGAEPPGVKTLATSAVNGELLQGNGASYIQNQTANVTVVKYKAASSALVVTTGTMHWNRGLALNSAGVGEPNATIQQATANVLADMGAQPATPSGIRVDHPAGQPAAPTGVTASATGADSVSISWAAVPGASGYNVYRSRQPRDGGYPFGPKANAALVTGTSFNDTGLNGQTTYYYVVTAVTNGVESSPSSEVSATTLAASQIVRVNSGGPAYTSSTGTTYLADQYVTGGSTYAITQTVTGTNDPALYQNERWGQFTYTIPVANGTYDVRFHFAELYYGTAVSGSCVGKRIFSMDILNTTVSPDIANLDICAQAGGPRIALDKTVSGVPVTNGTLTIKSVYGSVDDPEVTAIEVVPSTSSGPPTVTSTVPVSGATSVPVTTAVSASFSQPMDATTITTSSFTLTGPSGAVPATVAYSSTSNTATLTPSASLAASTTYTANLATTIKSSTGTALASPVSWSFTTAAADTTPPTVSITAPAAGTTVSGTTSVTANASDNVGVTSVQFKLDGTNIGSPVTTAPYTISWDTTTATNGAHTLTAVASDAAGNTTTSAGVGVTVQNTASAALVGDQTIESGADNNVAGVAEAFKATASATGTVTSLSVYVDSGSAATKLTAGLYADSGGHPGSLLAQGTLTAPVAASWNSVPLSASAGVTSGTAYWIALLSPSGTGSLKFRDRCCAGTGTATEVSSSSALATLPATWATGSTSKDGPASAYGVGTTTNPALSVTPGALSFGAVQGGAAPPAAQLSVTNTGTGSLSFTAASDAAWLSVSPATGTAPQTLQVSASPAGLAVGTYTGHVTVTAAGVQGSPATVTVTFAVSQPGSAADWTTIDHDPSRSGAAAAETAISTGSAPNLTQAWATAVDGKVTSQPLYARGVQVGGQAHDVVVVGTAANSVYALDAGSGAVLWRRNFGSEPDNCAIPGGFGVTASPVIDRSVGRVYTVADDGTLHALALADGTDAAPPQQLISGAATNKVWGGLNLVNGTLYIASASDGCDTAPWRGQIYRVDVTGATPHVLGSWAVVPGIAPPNGGGGIWGYGGVAVDTASGNVYAATGADSNETYQQYADRMVALDPLLNLLGSYGPPEPSTFPCAGAPCDLDFGATPLVFQPSGCPTMVVAGNKNGNLYLFKASDLALSAAPLQVLTLNSFNDSLGAGGIGGVPAYWAAGNTVFVTDAGPGVTGIAGGVVALAVQPNCTLQPAWSVALGANGQPNSTPTIANGVVFAGEGNGGLVHAYNAQTGASLWSGKAAAAKATYGAPTVADGKVFAGSWNGFTSADAGTVAAFSVPVSTTVSITAPAGGATVSGTTTVTASTTGSLAGVQFKLDGANLGAEDTAAPYSVSWDTTKTANGAHTLTAVALDASGATLATSAPVSVTVQNVAATKVLVGDQVLEASIDFDDAGQAEATVSTASAAGTLAKVSVYVDATNASTKVLVGVYSDSGGHPGTLLAQGTLTAPVAGAWNDVAMSAASIASGTPYWIAVLSPAGSGRVEFRDRCCGLGTHADLSSQTTLTALPATWSSGGQFNDGPISAYASGS